jgi:hypothetical protein
LGTWHGKNSENWIADKSTMLQVLVSIQALILNEKPYFNEPGYAESFRAAEGQRRSKEYNDNTFILSLKTMMYTLRKPPKVCPLKQYLILQSFVLIVCVSFFINYSPPPLFISSFGTFHIY